MRDTDILEVFEMIHRIFPLPTQDSAFRGTHGFTVDRETEKLVLGIWYWSESTSTVRCRTIIFDDEEISESLLFEVKHFIDNELPKDESTVVVGTYIPPIVSYRVGTHPDGRVVVLDRAGFVASRVNGEWLPKIAFDHYEMYDEVKKVKDPERAKAFFEEAKAALQ